MAWKPIKCIKDSLVCLQTKITGLYSYIVSHCIVLYDVNITIWPFDTKYSNEKSSCTINILSFKVLTKKCGCSQRYPVKRSTSQKVYKLKGPQVKRSTSLKVPKSKGLQIKRSPVKRSTKIQKSQENKEIM